MRAVLVHNPTAGDGELGREALSAPWRDRGYDLAYCSTKDRGWGSTLQEPADLVVVAGGDGTVRKVFVELAGSSKEVVILPMGTANNVATSLGIPHVDPSSDFAELVEAAIGWPSRPFSVPEVIESETATRLVESMGGGLMARLVMAAEKLEARGATDKTLDDALELLAELIDHAEEAAWRVSIDGDDHSGSYAAVEVLNIKQVGPGIPLAPAAQMGDGLLDVVMMEGDRLEGLASYVRARRDGSNPAPPPMHLQRGADVVLLPPPGCPIHIDDKLLSTVEATLRTRIDSIELLVKRPG